MKVKPIHVQLEKLVDQMESLQEKHKITSVKQDGTIQSVVSNTKLVNTNERDHTILGVRSDKSKDNAHVSETANERDNAERILLNENFNYKLNIKWEDGHVSDFALDWLLTRNFSEDNRRKLDENYKMTQISWRSDEFEKICSRFDYGDIMRNDRTLLRWLESLATYGVAIVEKAGTQVGSMKDLASRVGFLKKTQYGETFRVEAKPGWHFSILFIII